MSKLFLSLILLSIMLLSLSLDINNTTNNNLSNQIIINATKVIISFSIDFIPIIGNIKCLGEAAFGKDLISGEKLSEAQRILSLLGGLPFGNYFIADGTEAPAGRIVDCGSDFLIKIGFVAFDFEIERGRTGFFHPLELFLVFFHIR